MITLHCYPRAGQRWWNVGEKAGTKHCQPMIPEMRFVRTSALKSRNPFYVVPVYVGNLKGRRDVVYLR